MLSARARSSASHARRRVERGDAPADERRPVRHGANQRDAGAEPARKVREGGLPAAIDTTSRRRSAIAAAMPDADVTHVLWLDREHDGVGRVPPRLHCRPSCAPSIRRASAARRAVSGSATVIASAATPRARSAPIRLSAMCPPPMKAIRIVEPRQDRGPNMAVPIRTIVAPSAIAASRSALIPMDSVSSACPRRLRSASSSRSRRKGARCAVASAAGSGMHIRPFSSRRGKRATDAASAGSAVGVDTAAGRIDAVPHLQQDLERRGVMRSLLVEPLRDPLAIDAVHPVEMRGHVASLVRLQPADEVPGDRQAAQRLELGQRLLQVVLAEIALTGRRRRRVSWPPSAAC